MKTNTATLRSKHMYRSLQLAILCGLIGIIGWLTACSDLEKFTVTFDSNGGSLVPAQQVSGKAQAPDPPTKDNYYFGGWYTDSNLANPYEFNKYLLIEDITLYAKWINITDISTGYTISIPSTTVTAGVASVLEPTVAKASSTPLSAADDYTLTIKTRPSGASNNALTINAEGKIAVADSVGSGDAGDYILEAQGKNAYTGTFEHTFNLTVTNCYAPESFQGKSYTITITDGVYPFASSGQATITFSNSGKDYAIKGDGVDVEDSEGTYSGTISCNTGEVLFLSGNLKDAVFTFTFTSSNSGDYSGELATSSQSGTFVEL